MTRRPERPPEAQPAPRHAARGVRPLALWALLLAPGLAAAADLRAPSRVDAAIVYPSAARVTRVARVDLPPGDSRVLLEGLPVALDDDSIRVEGKGAARARVHGVTVEPFTRAGGAAPEARAAEERLEALRAEDRALEDRIAQARARARFVESLRSTYSEERARNLAVRAVSSREWSDLLAFVEAQLAAANGEGRKAEAARRELAGRLAAAQAELEKLAAKRRETTKVVAVELASAQGGPLELAVSYLVRGATWRPLWDARLLPEAGTVELSLAGTVSQRTGEDWGEARLVLSTTEPGKGLWVPELEPRWLQKAAPPALLMRKAAAPLAAAPPPERVDEAGSLLGREGEAAEAGEAPLEAPLAEANMGLLSATFTAPRRETVDGAGRPRLVALARWTLKAEISRTSAPRIDPAAYLTATLQNDTGVPLLPGVARVSVGEEFVGRAPLALTAPGGELRLAFGADPRLEVERRVLERRHLTAGIIAKEEVVRYHVRTTVRNRSGSATSLRLLDLVPVSRDQAIVVKVLEGTTPPTRQDPDRPGVRLTELTLGAREEKVLELRYEVSFPRGQRVEGLEE